MNSVQNVSDKHLPPYGYRFEAEEIAKEHNLGRFFTRKLVLDAAKMHRLDLEEKEFLAITAGIYKKAMDAVKRVKQHKSLKELMVQAMLDPLPNPVTENAIKYLCYTLHKEEVAKAKTLNKGNLATLPEGWKHEARQIAEAHKLGRFFARKLELGAAKMHRLDPEEKDSLAATANIFAQAMGAVKKLGQHQNLTELMTIAALDPIPNPLTDNAVKYLCYKIHQREAADAKILKEGKPI